jgi:hypothetical protein
LYITISKLSWYLQHDFLGFKYSSNPLQLNVVVAAIPKVLVAAEVFVTVAAAGALTVAHVASAAASIMAVVVVVATPTVDVAAAPKWIL